MSRIYNPPHPGEVPPHPGEVLKDTMMSAGVTVTAFAKHLRVTRSKLSNMVNRHAAISADMALRLAAALGTSPEYWLRMQNAHDLWQAAKKPRPLIEPLKLTV
jgi:addiction module HigA family antidote